VRRRPLSCESFEYCEREAFVPTCVQKCHQRTKISATYKNVSGVISEALSFVQFLTDMSSVMRRCHKNVSGCCRSGHGKNFLYACLVTVRRLLVYSTHDARVELERARTSESRLAPAGPPRSPAARCLNQQARPDAADESVHELLLLVHCYWYRRSKSTGTGLRSLQLRHWISQLCAPS